jgi:hypothetical protein
MNETDLREILHCIHRELTRITSSAEAHEFMPRVPSPNSNDEERIEHLKAMLKRGS